MFRAAGAGIHVGSPVPRDLNGDVRSRAKTVEGEPLAALDARKPQRTESDNSGAEKRRGLIVGKGIGNRIDELFGSDGVFGVSAIDGVAGESRMVAEIFFAGAAIFAGAVRAVKPGDPHARTEREAARAFSEFFNNADDLMAGNQRG